MKVTRAGVDRSSTYLPDELPLINITKNAWDGTVGIGSAPAPDASGNQEPTEGEQLLLEVGATTILDGFVGAVTSARGSATIGVRRVHIVDIGDDNALLQGYATPGWVRPAESPAARWAAFVADFLPGTIDTTWLLTTHESGVTLPAFTYRSDSLFDDLLADTVRPTGKTVYIEGRRFHWHLATEGQTCALTIHDTTYNLSTSFPPLTVQRQKDGMDIRNHIYARNDAGVEVSVSDSTSITAHDAAGRKHQGYTEYGTDSSADMTRDIGVTLAERKDERVTWTYDIGPLTAAQAAALIPGSQMTVTVGIHDLSAAVKRIATVKLTYKHPDSFIATVELGYPKRFRRKPTKTTSQTGSTGSGGGGAGGCGGCGGGSTSGCGCGVFCVPGAQKDTYTRTVSGGGGTSEFAGHPDYTLDVLGASQQVATGAFILTSPSGASNNSSSYIELPFTGMPLEFSARVAIANTGGDGLGQIWFGLQVRDLPLAIPTARIDMDLAAGSLDLTFTAKNNPPSPSTATLTIHSAGISSGSFFWVRMLVDETGIRCAFASGSEPSTYTNTANFPFAPGPGVDPPNTPSLLQYTAFGLSTGTTTFSIDEIIVYQGLPDWCDNGNPGTSVPLTNQRVVGELIGVGDGVTKVFGTAFPYVTGSLEITAGGVPESNVTGDGSAGSVVFSEAPFDTEKVRASYLKRAA